MYPEFAAFSDSISKSNLARLYTVNKLINKRQLYGASNLLRTISTQNEVEQNLLDVAKIYLAVPVGAQLDSTQASVLKTIANKCPFESGSGVYAARVMLNKSGYRSNYTNDCEAGLDMNKPHRLANLGNESENDLTVFPNPANDKLSIQSLATQLEGATFEIYDLTGKNVLKTSLTGKSEISISGLERGVYLYKVFINNVPSKTGKIVIIR